MVSSEQSIEILRAQLKQNLNIKLLNIWKRGLLISFRDDMTVFTM